MRLYAFRRLARHILLLVESSRLITVLGVTTELVAVATASNSNNPHLQENKYEYENGMVFFGIAVRF